MDRADVERLLVAARAVIQHAEYVIIGSISVLGVRATPPSSMVWSIDVDLYPRLDPGRASEVADALGQGSAFESEYGYYADAVSPALPTLPDGWESRLIRVAFESGVEGYFLEPNDAAISKYVRGEDRDALWIRAGLQEKILSVPVIEYRLRETVMEAEERERVNIALEQDAQWLSTVTSSLDPGPR